MKGIVILAALILIVSCTEQKEFNGRIENRDLTWEDFVGPPDRNSEFDAFTEWYVYYKYDAPIFYGDTAKVKFEIWRELSDKSWVKKNAKSDNVALLKHEQGHYDIAKLFEIELRDVFNHHTFSKWDYHFEIDSIYHGTWLKYVELNKQYDIETNHMRDETNQKKWDAFFAEKLK